MQVALVMVNADGSSRELVIDRESTLIGRDEHAKFRIPIAAVSRRHCELIVKAGKVEIRDLGSSNGTYVNGRKTRSAELNAGDLITVGPVVFVVKVDGAPRVIDAKDCYAAGTVGLEDDDDDDAPPPARPAAPAPKPAAGKPADAPKPAGKPSILDDDDDEDGDVSDLLKDFKFDDDDDDDAPKKK